MHQTRVLFGTGAEAGQIQINVDDAAGKFRARRDTKGRYTLTINAETADGLFALEFPNFERAGLGVLKSLAGGPLYFMFKTSAEMLAVED